ncbi:hypothetical protein COLO4_32685 [Corchorus olitorius]|uniref:Calmodulin-binding protein n=1 Tax=Corchorus olitorius TaxID=93759 RepID=A0A1R3GYI0_9ROSI|nr:hypothetical protein COLO4_32685 [Corchorus olitorius]
MEMEVVVPVPPTDFNFDSACSSPYMTAPSSPQRFGNFFFSAPTSPTRVSSFYHFEFNFSGQLDRTSLSAEELFDGGKIKPLKPPPGYEQFSSTVSSPRSPRVSDIMFEPEEESSASQSGKNVVSTTDNNSPKSYVSSILSAISFSKGNRKWKLKDFLLFRSASEGRATGKDQLRKYALLSKKEPEDVKNSSFRSTESVGSVSSSRRRGPVSAHELHYTANRAVSEEMRRKTFLPYKQGLLGCLGFNPQMHEISRGIGSLTRG